MAATVNAFCLALIICSCLAVSSTKDFSFSFLPENEGGEEMPGKALINQDEEKGLATQEASRDLKTKMLAEAKKVEDAVRRFGLLRSSEEEKNQGVVVSKAGALLLCSLFPEEAELPDYCAGDNVVGKVREGVDAGEESKDENSPTNKEVSDQDAEDKEGTKEELTKPENKYQLLDMEQSTGANKNKQKKIYNNQGNNQMTVPGWLRTLGFRNFLQPQHGQGQSYGMPVGSYQTPSPLWYHNPISPYQSYQQHLHLQHLQQPPQVLQQPTLHLQQPSQHLHLHLPERTQMSSTNPDCQPGNFFNLEGKEYFLCEGGAEATEKEEGVKSRKKRNSMLTWPLPTKV